MQEVAAALRDHAGSQFGRKWLLSAASETPRASQKFSPSQSTEKNAPHPPSGTRGDETMF